MKSNILMVAQIQVPWYGPMTVSQELNVSILVLPGIAQVLVERSYRPVPFPVQEAANSL